MACHEVTLHPTPTNSLLDLPSTSRVASLENAKPKLLINEVAGNFGANSYLELYSQNGIPSSTSTHFGIVNLVVEKKMVRVHSMFNLPRFTTPHEFYYVIGNPSPEWITTTEEFVRMSLTPGVGKKIFGKVMEFIETKKYAYRAMILTESETPLSAAFPEPNDSSRGVVWLKDWPALESYLLNHQIDSLVLRWHGSSGECAEIDKYTPHQVKRLAYLPATLGSQWPEKISWNRCGKMMTPFDHEEFKGGPITPGHQNDCTRRSFTLEITRFLNKVPLETNVVLECPKVHKRQREDSFIVEEFINEAEVSKEMYSQMSQSEEMPEVCPTSDNLRQDMADVYMAIKTSDAKFRKVSKQPGTNTVTETIDNPEDNFKRSKMEEAIEHINQHQADKFTSSLLEKHYKWLHVNINRASPSTSTYFCVLCSKYLGGTRYHNSLANKAGVLYPTAEENMSKIRDHVGLEGHQKAVQLEAIDYAKRMGSTISDEIQAKIKEDNMVTSDIIRVVYFGARNYMSFQSHPRLIQLIEALGHNMGKSCHNPGDALKIAGFISGEFHSDLCTSLKEEEGSVYLILDGSDDRNQNHEIVLLFQRLGIDFLFTLHYCTSADKGANWFLFAVSLFSPISNDNWRRLKL